MPIERAKKELCKNGHNDWVPSVGRRRCFSCGIDKYPANAIRAAAWYQENKPRSLAVNRKNKLRHKYGLSVQQADEMLQNPCGVCGKPANGIDHDHDAGSVRGVLCNRCNLGIGLLGDQVENLENALGYLKAAVSL